MPLRRNPEDGFPAWDAVDWGSLDAWATLVALAARGWQADFDISSFRGRTGVRIGVEHPCWHGSLCEVGTWRVTEFKGEVSSDACEAFLRRAIPALAREARAAWEGWPHAVPRRGADGGWVESAWETRHFLRYPHAGVVLPERALPTEDLPGWPGRPDLREFASGDGDDPIRAMSSIPGMTEDSFLLLARLSPTGNGREWRNRSWSLAASLALYSRGGEKLAEYARAEWGADSLHPGAAARDIREGAADILAEWHATPMGGEFRGKELRRREDAPHAPAP